jgi:hypothetical protein
MHLFFIPANPAIYSTSRNRWLILTGLARMDCPVSAGRPTALDHFLTRYLIY